ncbi:GTP 3',8-cyclase MoaA [Thalassotalea fusca]
MLTDNFGRRFYYLRLSITDVCNFKCNYCLPDGYQCTNDREFLSLDEIKCLASSFAGLGTEKIRITGGEPSLRKDLPEIISACKQTTGIKTVALTSNGYKLPYHLPHWIDAGLDALNISIDSLDARQFHAITGQDKLATIMKGIDLALRNDFTRIKVNTVLLKQHNSNQIDQFIDWIKDTPITLRFIELMETGDNAIFFDQQHVSGQSIKAKLLNEGWLPCIRDRASGPAQEFYHPNYAGKIGLIMPYDKNFCQTCNRLRVSSLGKLHLCLFSENGISLKEALASNDPLQVQAAITELMSNKKATHFLQQRMTGATSNLSMLGG